MNVEKIFTTIDTHTGGNPTRILLTGLPKLIGHTMLEKMEYMEKKYDWIRKFLMNEPRGHGVMSGCLLVEPCNPLADIGIIYIETGGYLPMCGHDTIGCCTALIETGMVPVIEPYTTITIDTPAGLVEAKVHVENGKAIEVSFINIPSFKLKTITIYTEEFGEILCDIAYGGNFYGIIDARDLNLKLTTENATRIIDTAILLRNKINNEHDIIHPEFEVIKGLTHIEFFSESTHALADLKNTVVVPPGGIDRSPCGTGTSAKLATMYSKGEISLHEPFIYESIVGSIFKGKIIETTKIGELDAVIPEITGSAWIMGMNTFHYQIDDPLSEGFLLIPPFGGGE